MIGKEIDIEADVLIDGRNKLVIPGGIDANTHMEAGLLRVTTSLQARVEFAKNQGEAKFRDQINRNF